ELAPALRGARDLNEAREYARQILEPEPVRLPEEARATLERFKELLDGDAHEAVRELKAVGGDLRALRLALTGRERGPELWAIVAGLPPDETLRRLDAPLYHPQPPENAAPGSARAHPDVHLWPDGLRTSAHRQREALRDRDVAAKLAARAELRRHVRAQHHRRERQDLRRGSR